MHVVRRDAFGHLDDVGAAALDDSIEAGGGDIGIVAGAAVIVSLPAPPSNGVVAALDLRWCRCPRRHRSCCRLADTIEAINHSFAVRAVNRQRGEIGEVVGGSVGEGQGLDAAVDAAVP